MKNTKNANKGFTIIEVLIVLAIAGLIMLVVFLAVPALQRNSRNTQRKSDVSNLLGAVGEHIANNQGKVPIVDGQFAVQYVNSAPKLGFYIDAAKVTWDYNATVPGTIPVPAIATNDTVIVANYLKCNGNTPVTAGASIRSVVALYNIEGSGPNVLQCQET